MKHYKKSIVITLLVTLSGCGNLGYVISTYDQTCVRSDFEFEDREYRMFERKDLHKIMITPSLGMSMAHGAAKGATFGGVNIDEHNTVYERATKEYLKKEYPGQQCTTFNGRMVLDPQWEFEYSCKNVDLTDHQPVHIVQ